mmetsp:Transcript_1097/g.1508  ORF Transcript_1097/g.1508 Transcript_1097/m.1508 type:complete len:93 (-) Transcript_1097:149-427(-)
MGNCQCEPDRERQLPQGWVKLYSKTTGKEYYYNAATGKSTFEFPAEAFSHYDDDVIGRELPPGWVEKQSRTTGKTYYWNLSLQKSQFEFPTS